ncbi:MAG: hypothetical protein GY926_21060 [bacterium]|nr:hypothetical protein [bacterium]
MKNKIPSGILFASLAFSMLAFGIGSSPASACTAGSAYHLQTYVPYSYAGYIHAKTTVDFAVTGGMCNVTHLRSRLQEHSWTGWSTKTTSTFYGPFSISHTRTASRTHSSGDYRTAGELKWVAFSGKWFVDQYANVSSGTQTIR